MLKDPRPENTPWAMPYLTVSDCAASLAFYKAAFGWEPNGDPMEMDGQIMHAEMNVGGDNARVMFGPEGAFGSAKKTPKNGGFESPIAMFIYVDDVDQFYKDAVANGAESVAEPETMFWGDRTAVLRDGDGFNWTFATNIHEFDPSKAPG